MRELIISEAPLARVAQLAKETVEDHGGVISKHTHQATWFDNLRTDDDAWSRSGYLGTYQPFQAKDVRVRARVWAAWPRRWFLGSLFVGFAEAVIFFLMSFAQAPPAPTVWIVTAVLTFIAIGLSLLTYSTSWSASQDLEESLVRRLGAEAREDPDVPGDVYTIGGWKEHRKDLVEAAVEDAPQAETTSRSGGLLSVVRRGRDEDEDEETGDDEEVGADGDDGARSRLLGRFKRSKGDDEDEASEATGDEEDDVTSDIDEEQDEDDASHTRRSGLLGRFRRSKDDDGGETSEATDDEEDDVTSDIDEEQDEDDASDTRRSGLLGRFRRSEGPND